MILRLFVICALSLMLSGCLLKKKMTTSGRRAPIGNDFFLTQPSLDLPNAQSNQDSASTEKEYYEFNPYNETVKYYQEPAPKEVFAHHHTKNVFNMQQHIKDNQIMQPNSNNEQIPMEAEQKPKTDMPPQNTEKSSTTKPSSPTPKAVILKPKKKMGLVKIIPKPNQSTTTATTTTQSSSPNSNQAPIQPVTFPEKASKDFISLEDALKIIKQDGSTKATSSNTQPSVQQQQPIAQNMNPSSSSTQQQPILTQNTNPSNAQQVNPMEDDNPENKPIPLPFN